MIHCVQNYIQNLFCTAPKNYLLIYSFHLWAKLCLPICLLFLVRITTWFIVISLSIRSIIIVTSSSVFSLAIVVSVVSVRAAFIVMLCWLDRLYLTTTFLSTSWSLLWFFRGGRSYLFEWHRLSLFGSLIKYVTYQLSYALCIFSLLFAFLNLWYCIWNFVLRFYCRWRFWLGHKSKLLYNLNKFL